VVTISWAAREELHERIGHLPGGDDVQRRFEAVGTSRPVKLDVAGKSLVLAVVSHWLDEVGVDRLPEGIFELRNALADDRDHEELDSGER
jgi:hypothetical protein